MKNIILGVSYAVSLASVFAVGCTLGGLWIYGQFLEVETSNRKPRYVPRKDYRDFSKR